MVTFQFNPALEKAGSVWDISAPNAINVNELLQENYPPFFFYIRDYGSKENIKCLQLA